MNGLSAHVAGAHSEAPVCIDEPVLRLGHLSHWCVLEASQGHVSHEQLVHVPSLGLLGKGRCEPRAPPVDLITARGRCGEIQNEHGGSRIHKSQVLWILDMLGRRGSLLHDGSRCRCCARRLGSCCNLVLLNDRAEGHCIWRASRA